MVDHPEIPPLPPSTKQNDSHFLAGLSVESCDVLALPSPPMHQKREEGRRQSVAGLPLQDASNAKAKKTNKKRKSMGDALMVASTPIATTPIRKKRLSLSTAEKPPKSLETEIEILTPEKAATDDLAQLQSLVRAYTQLPYEQKQDSEVARAIFSIAQYPMAPAIPEDMDLAKVPQVDQETCFQSLKEMQPEIRVMDEGKQSEARMVAEITRCVPKRHRGRYRYFNIDTGKPVSWTEYEERYFIMLDEVNSVRSKEWSEYFDTIRNAKRETSKASKTEQLKSPPSVEQYSPGSGSEKSSACSPEEAAKEEQESGEREIEQGLQMLLPLPDRDQVSENPQVAQIEAQLWSDLDSALKRYSDAILELRAREAVEERDTTTSES